MGQSLSKESYRKRGWTVIYSLFFFSFWDLSFVLCFQPFCRCVHPTSFFYSLVCDTASTFLYKTQIKILYWRTLHCTFCYNGPYLLLNIFRSEAPKVHFHLLGHCPRLSGIVEGGSVWKVHIEPKLELKKMDFLIQGCMLNVNRKMYVTQIYKCTCTAILNTLV
jgi:hypothetical protein